MKVRNTLKVFKTVKHVSMPVNMRNEASFLLKKEGLGLLRCEKRSGKDFFAERKKKKQGLFRPNKTSGKGLFEGLKIPHSHPLYQLILPAP